MMQMKARPIRIDGDVAYITLTKGYTAIIDAADVPLVEGCNWFAFVKPRSVYAVRSDYSTGKLLAIRMHRVIMGDPEGLEIDHRDGDGLNNRRDNLREATNAQNNHNQRIRSDNTSGYKGVSWYGPSGKWLAYIKVNGKQRHLGYHATPEQASAAYAKASAKLHGEFGRTA
jgi:hypothetical protein